MELNMKSADEYIFLIDECCRSAHADSIASMGQLMTTKLLKHSKMLYD